MFEEMGDAGGTARLVGRARAIPDHMRHHRGAVIRDDQNLQAIIELELGDARCGRGAIDGDRYGHGGEAQASKRETGPNVEQSPELIEHRHHHRHVSFASSQARVGPSDRSLRSDPQVNLKYQARQRFFKAKSVKAEMAGINFVAASSSRCCRRDSTWCCSCPAPWDGTD